MTLGVALLAAPPIHGAEPDAVLEKALRRLEAIPVPTSLPLVGKEGRDADGYPTRFPDRVALRSLLVHRRFAELSQYFQDYQTRFEADPRYEYWPSDAAGAFHSSEPGLTPLLDAWVTESPKSFAPYLARGTHLLAVGWARRGTRSASKTSDATYADMEEALNRAIEDFNQASQLQPRLVAASMYLLVALKGLSRDDTKVLAGALRKCPSCFRLRGTYMYSLLPRWGGSYQRMTAFAAEGIATANPRMRLLKGNIYEDQAAMLRDSGKLDEALVTINKACALGDFWGFLFDRARIQVARGALETARKDLDRAAVLKPGEPSVLYLRAQLHAMAKEWQEAGQDLLDALRLDSTDSHAMPLTTSVAEALLGEAMKQNAAGHREEARKSLDLAAQIEPDDSLIRQMRKDL